MSHTTERLPSFTPQPNGQVTAVVRTFCGQRREIHYDRVELGEIVKIWERNPEGYGFSDADLDEARLALEMVAQ